MELIDKLLDIVDYIEISRDNCPVHKSSLRETDSTTEYVLTITETLYHWHIQQIDHILDDYDTVEMRMIVTKGLEIYEKEE
ncbi:hypothetical protein KKE60_07285 [Patescibacteria group bacterium]|nr:hypothetical protein [Patescibacteria group bacterium]